VKRYVLVFAFNRNLTKVLLIEKKRGPNGQAGKWNGLGGNVGDDEMYGEAASREFKEEAGISVPTLDWIRFANLQGKGYEIVCFWTRLDDDVLDSARTITDEKVAVWSVYPIVLAGSLPLACGLTWLIEMARASARGEDFSKYNVERRNF
jgi:8-oxo-dGTP pyrophosphatase MutT (NUDIX family)